jgi:hypothetical protein
MRRELTPRDAPQLNQRVVTRRQPHYGLAFPTVAAAGNGAAECDFPPLALNQIHATSYLSSGRCSDAGERRPARRFESPWTEFRSVDPYLRRLGRATFRPFRWKFPMRENKGSWL